MGIPWWANNRMTVLSVVRAIIPDTDHRSLADVPVLPSVRDGRACVCDALRVSPEDLALVDSCCIPDGNTASGSEVEHGGSGRCLRDVVRIYASLKCGNWYRTRSQQ